MYVYFLFAFHFNFFTGPQMFEVDEHPKPQSTPEALAKLPAVFKKGGTVTAGNASVSATVNMHNLGHLGSYIMSLGQTKELPCECCRGHISCPIDLKIYQNVCLNETRLNLSLGHLGS